MIDESEKKKAVADPEKPSHFLRRIGELSAYKRPAEWLPGKGK